MNKLDESSRISTFQIAEPAESFSQQESTLRSEVEKSLRRYFQNIEDEPVTDLHQMVMSEVEAPLIEAVMRYTGNNQSKASIMLGLNRGTLRTKLKLYGLL
jgi:Fis family transcriptional regulator, factor for inversion stimulation protein